MVRKQDATGRATPSETLEARAMREAYNNIAATRRHSAELIGSNDGPTFSAAGSSDDEVQVEFPTPGARGGWRDASGGMNHLLLPPPPQLTLRVRECAE